MAAATSPNDSKLPSLCFTLDVPPNEHDAAAPVIPVTDGGTPEEEQAQSIALRPAARDAYLLLEDLCLLISGSADGGAEGEPSFLRWGSLSRTFGLELVESIVSGFGPVVRNVSRHLELRKMGLADTCAHRDSTPSSCSFFALTFAHSSSASSPRLQQLDLPQPSHFLSRFDSPGSFFCCSSNSRTCSHSRPKSSSPCSFAS